MVSLFLRLLSAPIQILKNEQAPSPKADINKIREKENVGLLLLKEERELGGVLSQERALVRMTCGCLRP